jgi:hypothetical protein
MLKKFLIIFFIFFAAFMTSTNFAMALDGECEMNADNKIKISANGIAATQFRNPSAVTGIGDQYPAPFKYSDAFEETDNVESGGAFTNHCKTQPDFYMVKFFKAALCREDPFVEGDGTDGQNPDYSSCFDIFNDTGGKDIEILPDGETNLLEGDGLLLPLGSYPFFAVIVSNHLKIKHTQKYINGADNSRANLYGFGDNGTNTDHDTCFTINKVTTYSGGRDGHADADFRYTGYNTAHNVTVVESGNTTLTATMKCTDGNPDGDYDYATEIIDHFGNNKNLISEIAYEPFTETGVPGLNMAATMLQDDNESVATTPNNAKRIAAFYTYANPIIITENTVGFKLNFATTLAVSVDSSQHTQAGGGKIWAAKVGADPFTIQVQTKTRRVSGAWR